MNTERDNWTDVTSADATDAELRLVHRICGPKPAWMDDKNWRVNMRMIAKDIREHVASATGSAFDAIADVMQRGVTEEDWQKIYDATRERLIAVEYEGEDTRSNRVFCQMTISNALYDIRDARNKPDQKS